MSTEFFIANYDDPVHAQAIVVLLDAYAQDPMGGGHQLSTFARENLVATLATTPGAFSVLGLQNDQPVALANCFRGFSTFACKPLINVHDLAVLPSARGQGFSQKLLSLVEREARKIDSCKVTLEVLENNLIAVNAYRKFGFEPFSLDKEAGEARLLQKLL